MTYTVVLVWEGQVGEFTFYLFYLGGLMNAMNFFLRLKFELFLTFTFMLVLVLLYLLQVLGARLLPSASLYSAQEGHSTLSVFLAVRCDRGWLNKRERKMRSERGEEDVRRFRSEGKYGEESAVS